MRTDEMIGYPVYNEIEVQVLALRGNLMKEINYTPRVEDLLKRIKNKLTEISHLMAQLEAVDLKIKNSGNRV